MVANGFAARGVAGDTFMTLTRSAFPGSVAQSIVLWSGDINATFDSLYQQVRVVQTVAMSGVPHWARYVPSSRVFDVLLLQPAS